jgi:hypothetical protein
MIDTHALVTVEVAGRAVSVRVPLARALRIAADAVGGSRARQAVLAQLVAAARRG